MSKNNITGDNLISKHTTENYYTGWDLLWGKNPGSTVGEPSITDIDIIKASTIAGKEFIISASSGCNGKCTTCTEDEC